MGERLAHEIRRTIVDESMRAGVGHIGSALSIADLLAAVYGGALRIGLSNLIALVDGNGQQALGYTRGVLDPGPPPGARWAAFGWDVHAVDGHDVDALRTTIDALDTRDGPPHVLLAETTFRPTGYVYPHSPKDLFGELPDPDRTFDVGLAPLFGTSLNRSRSTVKLEEYASVGAMWLASPVGLYDGMSEHEGGLLVPDGAWRETLSAPLVDQPQRLQPRQAARAGVRTRTVQAAGGRYQRPVSGVSAEGRRACA